jgi:hypothetical protein
MPRSFIVAILFLACLSCFAQDDHEIACRAFPKATESYTKKLWDGYEISLGPARNATDAGEDSCTAAIYSRAGKVVYRTTGFGVIFDEEHTGMDFDGDGKGEVVFRTDQAGGAHCCWVYNVISLWPRPHKLFDVGEGAAVDFVKDKDGKVIIWERVGGPYQYTSGADRPYAERAYRVKDGKLVDSTPESCSNILRPGNRDFDGWMRTLTPENVKKLQAAKEFGAAGNLDLDEIVSSILSRAMQWVLCHQDDQALQDLNLWPEDSRDEMMDDFAESVKEYSPEFAARLAGGKPVK